LISAVYLNAGGTLDFTYQISNNAGSQGSISLTDALSFASWVTDVDYLTNGSALPGASYLTNGTVTPSQVFRSSVGTGVTVGFDFTASNIQPGQTSVVLLIRTNATTFTSGLLGLIAGGGANITAFQPH
jgi:hypothetical protein